MHLRSELRSKLVDGFLVALALISLSMLLGLLIRPIQISFGKPGILVYAVVMLAGSIIAIERSISQKVSEPYRAIWGLGGGLVTWAVIELSSLVGTQAPVTETGILTLMLVSTATTVLWKRVLLTGLKFYLVMFLASWACYSLIHGLIVLEAIFNPAKTILQVVGYVSAGLTFLVSAWILFGSRNRLERMWGALAIWICLILLFYVFRGGLY